MLTVTWLLKNFLFSTQNIEVNHWLTFAYRSQSVNCEQLLSSHIQVYIKSFNDIWKRPRQVFFNYANRIWTKIIKLINIFKIILPYVLFKITYYLKLCTSIHPPQAVVNSLKDSLVLHRLYLHDVPYGIV